MDFDERAALFEEALEVIRGIWTTDDYLVRGPALHRQGHHRPSASGEQAASADLDRRQHGRRPASGSTTYGDGWCPFPAPAVLAQTARTAAMDSVDSLAEGIADLRRRCDAAGRDWSGIDITFTNIGGGSPGDDDFNADAYLSGLEKLAAVGVTWVQVGVPGDSLAACGGGDRARSAARSSPPRDGQAVGGDPRDERDLTVGADGLSLGHTAAPADP